MSLGPLAVVALAAACLLAGCSSAPGPAPREQSDDVAAGEGAAAEPVPSEAWSVRLRPLSRVEAAGDVGVVLVRARGDEIDLVALDAATGAERWRRPWSPGQVPNGYALSPSVGRVDGREVIVLQDPGRGLSGTTPPLPLELVDPADGETLARTRPVDVLEPAADCASTAGTCVALRGPGGEENHQRLRLDGSLGGRPDLPLGASSIGSHGLFARYVEPAAPTNPDHAPSQDLGPAADTVLGQVRGGRVRWTQPLLSLQGSGYDLARGWHFAWEPETRSWIGSVGAAFDPDEVAAVERGGRGSIDLSAQQLISISVEDGQRRWGGPGLGWCGLDPTVADGRLVPVRCAISGRSVSQRGRDLAFRDLELTVEGFDPVTGESTWGHRVADSQAEAVLTDTDWVHDDQLSWILVVADDGSAQRLSTADGTLAPVAAGTTVVCDRAQDAWSYAQGDEVSRQRTRGALSAGCRADGTAVPGRIDPVSVDPGSLAAEATEAAGLALLTTPRGVTAYRR